MGETPDLAASLNVLGNVLWHQDHLDEAERVHRRALRIREGELPADHPDIAQSLHNIASLRFMAGDLAEAERLYLRSSEIEEAVGGPYSYNLGTSLHTLAMVYEVAGVVQIPVVGCGGITSGNDAIEFIMAGASAVQVGTASFINPSAPIDVLEGIEQFMSREGVKDIGELIGTARR